MKAGSTRGRCTLPARYQEGTWEAPFHAAAAPMLQPGAMVLDIGSGRRPIIPVAARPPGCTYFGLDLSQAEFDRAPSGCYDRTLVGDVLDCRQDLVASFDLVVSWQVLEHVRDLSGALDNIRSYLRPGGLFVGQLSGTFSLFALVNMAVPHRVATSAMHRVLGVDPTSVFPAYYDKCWYSALERLGRQWSTFSVQPRHAGAGYLTFLRPAQRLYLSYENWTIRSERRNLATHYLLVGER